MVPQGTQVSVQTRGFLYNMCGGQRARVLREGTKD